MRCRWTAIALSATTLFAGSVLRLHATPETSFRYGADERVRQEYFDHVPSKVDSPAYSRNGENDYIRFRTRIWAEASVADTVILHTRLANEQRLWFYPDVSQSPQRSSYEWPDEWIFDTLNVELRNLLSGSVDLCVGRQDLTYGNGRVIWEGTPGDGSRSLYFDAVKATIKTIPASQLDIFGIYNEPEDELAINPADRNLSGFGKAKDGVTESGGGLYLKNNAVTNLPFEAYVLFKREAAWDQAAKTNAAGEFTPPLKAWQTASADGKTISNPEFDLWTIGFRLMPVFTPSVCGNLEAAVQAGRRGDQDAHGFMFDASLTKKFVDTPSKPAVKAGVYGMSGDDPKTADDEGWNPVWARYPQFSELTVLTWDAEESSARWSNLLAPNLGLNFAPWDAVKTTMAVYYLSAFEADGNGGGKERGWLGSIRTDFTFAENKWLPKDKLTGHLLLEVLEPGNYYRHDDTAVFARWELAYAF